MRVSVPNERKFEIYHAIHSEKLSRDAVARRYRLSLPQLEQLLIEVGTFVMEYGSDELLNTQPERMELAALRVCHARLSHFYKSVMRQWTKLGETDPGSAGRVRLLQAAARISMDQVKLAGRIAKVQMEMIEAGTLQYEAHQFVYEPEEEVPSAKASTSPPVRGCTAETVDDPDLTPEQIQALEEIFVKLGPDATTEQLVAGLAERGLLHAFEKTPAQLPQSAGHAMGK